MAQCKTCGSTVPDTASVCPDCGMEMQVSAGQPASAPASPAQAQPAPSPAPQSAASATAASARVTVRRGGVLTQDSFPLGTGPSILGRFDPETGPVDVDLGALPEAVYVSRHHAEISCDESGQWVVRDLGSGNGTFVCRAGDRKFQKVGDSEPINDGDDIALGNARFEFRIG